MSRFERLYRDNFPFVWAAARRLGAPEEAVGDVVQDVFVTAHRRLDELRYEVSPRGWLYGVTRRVASRYRRTAARTARRKAAVAARAIDREHPPARHDAARELDGLLREVDEDQRDAFVMAELLGMTGPEIAGELRIPLPTVYSRLRLAKHRLARAAEAERRLEQCLDAARRDQAPAPGQAQRSWAALLPIVGSPWPAVKVAVAATAASIWTPLAVVTVLAIGIAHRSTDTVQAGGEDVDTTAASGAKAREAPATEADGEATPGPAADPASASPPASSAQIASSPSTQPGPAVAATSVAKPATPDSAALTPDDLADEVRRLETARQALRRGDAAAALSALDALDDAIQNGQLLDARRAARVRALCDLGRAEDAAREAARLHRDHPTSTVAKETPPTCDAS